MHIAAAIIEPVARTAWCHSCYAFRLSCAVCLWGCKWLKCVSMSRALPSNAQCLQLRFLSIHISSFISSGSIAYPNRNKGNIFAPWCDPQCLLSRCFDTRIITFFHFVCIFCEIVICRCLFSHAFFSFSALCLCHISCYYTRCVWNEAILSSSIAFFILSMCWRLMFFSKLETTASLEKRLANGIQLLASCIIAVWEWTYTSKMDKTLFFVVVDMRREGEETENALEKL